MKKLLKLMGVFALVVGILTGCSSAPKEDAGDANTNTGTTAANELVVAIGGEPTYLDPAIAGDAVSNYVTKQMYEGLFSVKPDGSLQNELCESFTVSEDGLVYTYTLTDANWSDGQPITAEDFVYGMKRSIAYGSADAYYGSFLTKTVKGGAEASAVVDAAGQVLIEELPELGIKALDDKTLEITLEKPVPYFNQLLVQGATYPIRSDFAEEKVSAWADSKDVPVSGAFMFESRNASEEIVLVKNPNYRNADQVTLEKITFKIMPDGVAQLNAFKAGELDFAMAPSAETAKTYEGKPELFTIDPYVINYFVTVNAGSNAPEALQDANVRKALSMAVDRDELIAIIDAGETYYPLYGFIPRGMAGVNGDFREEQDAVLKLSDTNVEEAKALMAKAGYDETNPLTLTYYYNDSDLHRTVAQVLQEQWKRIGVNVELKTAEVRVFFDDRTNANFELARHANSADYLDPMIYLEMYMRAGQGTTKVVDDQKYEDLIAAANAESDPKVRLEKLHDAENYFVNEMAYIIPLFGYTNPELLRQGITGIETSPDGAVNFRYTKVQ